MELHDAVFLLAVIKGVCYARADVLRKIIQHGARQNLELKSRNIDSKKGDQLLWTRTPMLINILRRHTTNGLNKRHSKRCIPISSTEATTKRIPAPGVFYVRVAQATLSRKSCHLKIVESAPHE